MVTTTRLRRYMLPVLAFFFSHAAGALPAGFEDEGVVRIHNAVDIAFVGSMMLAVTKSGMLYSFDLADPNADIKKALDLTGRICDNGERG